MLEKGFLTNRTVGFLPISTLKILDGVRHVPVPLHALSAFR